MKLSVLKEVAKFENRVAATPDSVKLLTKIGFDVFIENDAGIKSGFMNEDYQSSGAKVVDRKECLNSSNISLVVQLPPLEELQKRATSLSGSST